MNAQNFDISHFVNRFYTHTHSRKHGHNYFPLSPQGESNRQVDKCCNRKKCVEGSMTSYQKLPLSRCDLYYRDK